MNNSFFKINKQLHTSRNCFSSPLTVHSRTTAFISPEGESLLSTLVSKVKFSFHNLKKSQSLIFFQRNQIIFLHVWGCCFPLIWIRKMQKFYKNRKENMIVRIIHTLLWSQCSFLMLQSRPLTCHRGIQCTAYKTWHSHSSPDRAGSTLLIKAITQAFKAITQAFKRTIILKKEKKIQRCAPQSPCTCVDVAVFAPILRGNDGSHVCSAQTGIETELPVQFGYLLRVGHHLMTHRICASERDQLPNGEQCPIHSWLARKLANKVDTVNRF